MKPRRRRYAFTLIELLVVLGIVALMAGTLGLALRDGDPARGLESAQATLTSVLAAAHSQAAVNQNRVLLAIDADPGNDRFLRALHVAVETAPNSGLWWLTDNSVMLPHGVYVVPQSGSVEGATYAPIGTLGPWAETRHSSLRAMPASSVALEPDNPAGKYLGMIAPLTAAGLSGSGGGDKFVLGTGRRTPAGVVFEHPAEVCGIALGAYGSAIQINDATGFDF